MKIGAITIGQAPRIDVTADILPIFGGSLELIEKGGLDGLSHEEIAAFAPGKDDYVLVSRLNDGSHVTFAERFILPRLQDCISTLEKEDVRLIMFFCTGDFPDVFVSSVPMIFPCRILDSLVPQFSRNSDIIVLTPSRLQVEQSHRKWEKHVSRVRVLPASPYTGMNEVAEAARRIRDMDGGDLIVLDCIGYSQEMKKLLERETGRLVVLSRTLLARTVSELTF